MINNVITYLQLDKKYKKFLVDDLVENNDTYKQRVHVITENVFRQCIDEKKYCLDEECKKCDTSKYYINPSIKLLDDFYKAYNEVRIGPNCVKDYPLNCNDYNDMKLREAISNNDNIVFETTGLYIPNWLLTADSASEGFINNKYNVIFAYNFVNFNELIERNKKRILESLQKFTEDHTNPGPRLPNIEHDTFKKTVIQIKQTLLKLYNLCILNHDFKECGKTKINKLLLFDNNGPQSKLLFDSSIAKISIEKFVEMVNNLFGSELDGGKRNLSKKRRYKLIKKKSYNKITNRRKYSRKL
jgi:hypothetical protein